MCDSVHVSSSRRACRAQHSPFSVRQTCFLFHSLQYSHFVSAAWQVCFFFPLTLHSCYFRVFQNNPKQPWNGGDCKGWSRLKPSTHHTWTSPHTTENPSKWKDWRPTKHPASKQQLSYGPATPKVNGKIRSDIREALALGGFSKIYV